MKTKTECFSCPAGFSPRLPWRSMALGWTATENAALPLGGAMQPQFHCTSGQHHLGRLPCLRGQGSRRASWSKAQSLAFPQRAPHIKGVQDRPSSQVLAKAPFSLTSWSIHR